MRCDSLEFFIYNIILSIYLALNYNIIAGLVSKLEFGIIFFLIKTKSLHVNLNLKYN